jgi:hypothetical protein
VFEELTERREQKMAKVTFAAAPIATTTAAARSWEKDKREQDKRMTEGA